MKIVKQFILVGLISLLPGLQPGSAFAQSLPAKKVQMGAILTLSGSFASVGEDCRRGIEAALDVSKARDSLEVVYADSKNEPLTAISELEKLATSDQVQVVYTHRSTIGMALNPPSAKLRMPLLGAVAHRDFAAKNELAFQVWSTSDEEGDYLAEQFKKLGYRRIAILTTEDDWTLAVTRRVRAGVSQAGIEIVFDEALQPTDTDPRSLMPRLKHSSPDAIFLNVVLPQIGPLVRQVHQAGVQGSLFSNIYVAKKDVSDALGVEALEGIRFVEIDTELPSLNKQLGLDPQLSPPGLTVASYLATLLVAQAVKEEKSIPTTKEMFAALSRQTELRTPDHVYVVKERRVRFPLVLKTIRGGKPQREVAS